MIFVIRVTTNKEDQVADLIAERAKKKTLNVASITRPHGTRGYLFVEADNRETVEQASYNLQYVKGIINKTVEYEEIKNLIEPLIAEVKIEKGDIVEIVAEPFKKSKAKVIKIDKSKEEAVVELLEAAVPIPITVKIDNVRVIRREEKEDEEEETEEENF
jgi:transcriptional antiterminator NusG